MILVDTSIWVDHLSHGDAHLAAMLRASEVACHPFVLGELACGRIRRRTEILRLLAALPMLPRAADDEALLLIEKHQLMGLGLGFIDVHLLAACLLSGSRLWTRDRALSATAAELGCAAK